tara:strand:+ start:648 stop:1556 length:909 start_codon:yes stop_codon:yes gene_type:complete
MLTLNKKKSIKMLTNPHLLLSLSALFWGFNAIAGRSAVGEVSPLLIVSCRWLGVSIFLTFLCRKELFFAFKKLKTNFKWFVIMGLFGFTGFNSLYYISAHHTIAINLGIVQSTMPAFIIIISMFWLKTKIVFMQLVGLLVTFFGVLIIICNGDLDSLLNLKINKGDLIMTIACVFYAIYAVGLKKKPKLGNLLLITFFSYIAFIGSIPGLFYEIASNSVLLPTSKGLLILMIIIIFPSFLAQIFFIKGVEGLGPSTSGLYVNLVPIFTAILAVLILDESFYFFHLLSLLIVFFGIYLFERKY